MNNSIFKDALEVAVSNITILLGGICTGFIFPIMLGATNYGYYKTFILYTSYVALLHFGFVDGILILDGGKSFKELDLRQCRANSKFFIIFQFMISIILSLISLLAISKFYKILFISLGLYTFFFNIMTYYQFVSQATMQFKQLSIAQIMQASLNVLFTLCLYLFYKFNVINRPTFMPCILIFISVFAILSLWYVYKYKNITFGESNNIIKTFNIIFKYFKYGIYITISYQAAMLLINLDNQFVSLLFGAYVYGIYSFAYSLVNIINTLLSSVSNVLLPHLKKMKYKSKNNMLHMYPIITSYILLIIFLFFIGYFPVELIIKIFFIKYIKSLIYFKILLPGIAINCCISLIMFAYYNALNKSRMYLFLSFITLCISFILYMMLYMIFRSVIALALGSNVVLMIWSWILERYLIKVYKVKWFKNFIYLYLMICIFYVCGFIHISIFGAVLYILLYVIVSYSMFKNILLKIYNQLVLKVKIFYKSRK